MNIFTAKKYEEKIKSIVTLSKEYSISNIASIAGLSEDDTIKLIEKMINKSRTGNLDYRSFRNAHVNYQDNLIVLDETKSTGFSDKLGKMTNAFMEKFTPKVVEEKVDWKCNYCESMNAGEAYFCTRCGAKKE